ncbi:MAG: gliding motility-associated C-terminal domain-containing protein [Flavobacteriales bacterium]|nr:gliding motility-associated C-terminal domain-containing protein [Flavobacteriales bacterium]
MEVVNTGTYWVQIDDQGCTASDTISVTFIDPPVVDLGPDLTFCAGDAVTLGTGLVGLPHTWQDGSSEETYAPVLSGTYWVQVGAVGCTATDSVEVMVLATPEVELGADTVLCSGSTLLLDIGATTGLIEWQDGIMDAQFVVSSTGLYWVTLDDQGCTASDTISVTFIDPPVVDLGPGLTFCAGDAVTLGTGLVGLPHTWQDGSSEETYTPVLSGTYWVQVGAVGCSATDSVEVLVVAIPEVELGADTVLCSGSTLLLDLGSTSGSIEWQDGSTDAQFVVSSTGLYWVTLDDQGCIASDTISVTFIDPPIVDLGPDLTFCAGDAVTLGTGLVGLPHTWQDGSSEETYTPVISGTYWVQVGAVGCLGVDSVDVEVVPLPLVSLGPDTVVCEVVDLLLVSGHPASASTWQDGTMASTYQATGPGVYSVEVVVDGCTSQASITIGLAFMPMLSLPGDTVLCTADAFIVQASSNSNDPIVWQDGSQGAFLVVVESGTYWANMSNACGSVSDTVRITYASALQVPEDMLVCPGETASIEWSDVFGAILWNTGSSSADIALPEGEYTYTAVDLLGCPHAGALLVFSDPGADGVSYVPNVFTPQGDGVNDRFLVVGADSDGFLLEIYNRWGELLHSSTDPLMGWDGRYNGRDVPDGTYVYVLSHRASCGGRGTTTKVGHVTVLR